MPQRQDLGSYGQFCPVAMAAEIICSRWTALIVRELLCGSTRFNDLRRGVPLMSPTLLSKRLKELEEAGVIVAVPTGQPGVFEYKLTEAGQDLRPVGESGSVVQILQGNRTILWTSLSGSVGMYRVEGWPTTVDGNDLGGAVVMERPADGAAGVIAFGEKPKAVSFEISGS